jgi:hypothetical protein
LSGRHAGGYEQEEEAGGRERKAEVKRVEEFRDETMDDGRSSRREDSRHEVEEIRDETVLVREPREVVPKAPAGENVRDKAATEREPQHGRDGDHRHQYIALKPDPANDPAPRRLRAESAKPPQIVDYVPSRATRAPDKTLPLDRREKERERGSAPAARPKAHATIDIHKLASSKEKPSGGLLGMIKRVLGFGGDVKEKESRAEKPMLASDDEHRHGSGHRHESERDAEGPDGDGSRRRRRRRRGGRGRHSGGQEPGPQGHRHHGDV